MLRKFRISLALIFFCGITLLFLDFTGLAQKYLGWMAKIQFLPALLALNAGVIIALVVLTLLSGRVYCSTICPLGVMQDIFAWFGKQAKRNRYSFSKARNIWRYTFLGIMTAAIIFGIGSIVALLAPYSAYGRIAQNLIAPIWAWGNNILADIAEHFESYTFYSTDIWIRSIPTFTIAIATLVILGILAWRNGRTYCNTICPVGTLLGFLSRFSLLRPVIDISKCNSCGSCSRNCKGACINSKEHRIDYSRCVACMDCIDRCSRGAISYTWGYKKDSACGAKQHAVAPHERDAAAKEASPSPADGGRREFLTASLAIGASTLIRAQQKMVDGGLAVIVEKKSPKRSTPIVPPGAISLRHLTNHCTGCQLCVAACPNGVLRPSGDLETLMQPRSSYERGYCRPECTRCSEACPSGAIINIDKAEKSSIQVGHAVWIKENCIPLTDGVACGNCARHCPSGAITMVAADPENTDPYAPEIPVVNEERCIGCGACENLCPARPFSAIYVEGHENHKTI